MDFTLIYLSVTTCDAIRHNILEFCARVLASSRVTAQDSSVALLDLRGAVGLALWVTVAMIES